MKNILKYIKYQLKRRCLIKRADTFDTMQHKRLQNKILKDTHWLAVSSYSSGRHHSLPFHQQAIKYYEYKNMVIQRRAQSVIIFLTIALLIMTAVDIYFRLS